MSVQATRPEPSQRPVSDGVNRAGSSRRTGRADPRTGPESAHPTRHAPLVTWIGKSRYVVLLAVVSVLLVAVTLFVLGAGLAVQGVWHALMAVARGELAATAITVELLELVSVMFKAVVFYLIGVGFYSLFIAPLNLTAALGIRSFNDLEIKILSVVVVIMAVTFLEHFIRWEQAVETLMYAISLAVVVAALVFFQMHSYRESRDDEQEDSQLRLRAQRELFEENEEERDIRPDDKPASAPDRDKKVHE